MALTLVVLSGNQSKQTPLTLDGPRIVVGRASNSDLRLPDLSVSARHASFRQRGSEYLILDEGSTNGTFVGPVRLSPQAPRVVRTGDHVRFGRIWIEVRLESVPATTQTVVAAKDLASRLLAEALATSAAPVLPRLVSAGESEPGSELVLELEGHRYVLGRANDSDFVLVETNASRRHAEVFRRGGQVYARDLGSKNGTLLGELELPSKSETPWPAGAKLQIGKEEIALVDPVAEALIELERAADEVIAEDEEIQIPVSSDATVATAQIRDPKQIQRGPVARQTRRPPVSDHPGLHKADVLVAFVAISVLGASLFGLYWLLSGR
jgi:pSer/pThr/pTyr-binding forkhead associated (FHA) protein